MAKKTPKDKAWESFSRWKRVKDCLETTGFAFLGICITCNRQFHIRALEAGHLISGRRNAVLFDEELVNIQCGYDNRIKQGRPKKYRKVMVAKYGEEFIVERELLKNKVIQDIAMDFEGIKKTYDEKYKELMRAYGFKTWMELLKGGE